MKRLSHFVDARAMRAGAYRAAPHAAQRAAHRRAVWSLAFVMLFAACRKTTDMVQLRPADRVTLGLSVQSAVGDTARLALVLGVGAVGPLGSVTGAVRPDAAWHFVRCEGAQGEPLLACRVDAAASRVRLAAAWAGGTHAGPLVTMVFARNAGALSGTTVGAGWELTVDEAHGVAGHTLTDSLFVRREVTP